MQRHSLRVGAARAAMLISADILGLAVAFLVAGLVPMLFSEYMTGLGYADLFVEQVLLLRPPQILGLSAALVVWLMHHGHYTQRLPFWIETRQVVNGCLFALLCDGFLQYALKHEYSRLWLVNTWLLGIPAILLLRVLARRMLRMLGLWDIPVMVVGSVDRLAEATALLHSEPGLGYRVVAEETFDSVIPLTALGWQEACAQRQAHLVVLAAEETDLIKYRDQVSRLALERLPFLCIQPVAGLPVLSLKTYHLVGHDLLLLVEQGRLDPLGRTIKAAFDRCVALFLLILLLPLLAVLALLVRRDGGPVFYVHHRIGQHGKSFACLKFRTMRPDARHILNELLAGDASAREEWTATMKLRHDPRITTLGRFMRVHSLDELPQLINVLRGEMSLVGPRPIDAIECDRFGHELGYYYQVKPGITGLWQVSGRNSLEYEKRVHLNTWYVKNWSLWLDVVILAKTIPTVASRRDAF